MNTPIDVVYMVNVHGLYNFLIRTTSVSQICMIFAMLLFFPSSSNSIFQFASSLKLFSLFPLVRDIRLDGSGDGTAHN